MSSDDGIFFSQINDYVCWMARTKSIVWRCLSISALDL